MKTTKTNNPSIIDLFNDKAGGYKNNPLFVEKVCENFFNIRTRELPDIYCLGFERFKSHIKMKLHINTDNLHYRDLIERYIKEPELQAKYDKELILYLTSLILCNNKARHFLNLSLYDYIYYLYGQSGQDKIIDERKDIFTSIANNFGPNVTLGGSLRYLYNKATVSFKHEGYVELLWILLIEGPYFKRERSDHYDDKK